MPAQARRAVTFPERPPASVAFVGGAQPTARRAPGPAKAGRRSSRRVSPRMAVVLGSVVLALMIAEPPLSGLARQSVNATGGSVPVWYSAAFAVVGLVVAWRKPRNPLGWIMLAVAGFFALSEDASFYAVADYRLRHGGLPLGWIALLAQPGWAPAIVLAGLIVFLFPDGMLPSPRLRWVLWPFLGVAAVWIAGTVIITIGAIVSHRTSVDPAGTCSSSIIPPARRPGGEWSTTYCSRCWGGSAGWSRWLPRSSATGGPSAIAASS